MYGIRRNTERKIAGKVSVELCYGDSSGTMVYDLYTMSESLIQYYGTSSMKIQYVSSSIVYALPNYDYQFTVNGKTCVGILHFFKLNTSNHFIPYVKIGNDWYNGDNETGFLRKRLHPPSVTTSYSSKPEYKSSFIGGICFYIDPAEITDIQYNGKSLTGVPTPGQTGVSCGGDSIQVIFMWANGYREQFRKKFNDISMLPEVIRGGELLNRKNISDKAILSYLAELIELDWAKALLNPSDTYHKDPLKFFMLMMLKFKSFELQPRDHIYAAGNNTTTGLSLEEKMSNGALAEWNGRAERAREALKEEALEIARWRDNVVGAKRATRNIEAIRNAEIARAEKEKLEATTSSIIAAIPTYNRNLIKIKEARSELKRLYEMPPSDQRKQLEEEQFNIDDLIYEFIDTMPYHIRPWFADLPEIIISLRRKVTAAKDTGFLNNSDTTTLDDWDSFVKRPKIGLSIDPDLIKPKLAVTQVNQIINDFILRNGIADTPEVREDLLEQITVAAKAKKIMELPPTNSGRRVVTRYFGIWTDSPDGGLVLPAKEGGKRKMRKTRKTRKYKKTRKIYY
jgi:hypothetical protein